KQRQELALRYIKIHPVQRRQPPVASHQPTNRDWQRARGHADTPRGSRGGPGLSAYTVLAAPGLCPGVVPAIRTNTGAATDCRNHLRNESAGGRDLLKDRPSITVAGKRPSV